MDYARAFVKHTLIRSAANQIDWKRGFGNDLFRARGTR